ncbi:MAG: PKD domain-containing protein [Bacteroidales bacterium]
MNKIILTFSVCTFIFFLTDADVQSQPGTSNPPDTADYPYWIEMMQDQEVNFFDVQRAAEIYWKDRKITRGCGWKPYKRWEHRMRTRVFPNGERRPEDHLYREYQKYLEIHPGARSQNGNWENLGPFFLPGGKGYKGLGRLNAIAFHPTDTDVIYVGSPSGGLWETNDGGLTWSSTTDDLPTLGVSAILVNYNDPDVILMGTGDRDAGDAFGMGTFKSTDGGETWFESNTGMNERTVGRLIQHPTVPGLIYAACNGGIFKSTDLGDTWVNLKTGNFKDIVFKPDDPSILFATASGNFFRSDDAGNTWTEINSGLPGGSRGVIAVTPANPDYVYFLITNAQSYKGTYLSTDAGLNFTERSTSPNIMSWGCNGGDGGQAWYDLDIAADPLNEYIIYAGGVNCFKSIDGGLTWEISSHWWGDCSVPAVHADLHVLEWNPADGRLYAGNDGGIYWTDDGGASWPEISDGLPISQVYKIGQSATNKDKVINGYQDNGTSTYTGNDWQFTRGGDGMECAVDHKDDAYTYATIYYGSINRYHNNNFDLNVAGQGNYGITENGAWITPFILDEEDENTMFVGYKNVWRCYNVKASGYEIAWEKISDNLGGNNGTNMAVLEQSPADIHVLYAARYDNKLFRSDNVHAETPDWTNLSPYLPFTATPTDLEAHPDDPDVVYMTINNKIFKSPDRGLNWEDISGTLPDVYLSSIAFYENSHNGLYLGSDAGVFYRDDFMDDWIWFNNGLPADASVNEVEIYYHPDSISEDVIRAGTYGRGLWSSDMYCAAPEAAFTASDTLIPPGCPVDFTDLSSGVPHFREWTFEGGIPETSYKPNPTGIAFDSTGAYAVSLKVTNTEGTDSITLQHYIVVSDTITPVAAFTASDTITCTEETIHFTDGSKFCPNSWQWDFSPDEVAFMEGTSAQSQHPAVQFNEPGMYSVTLTVENSNGQDSKTKENYILYGGYGLPFTEDFEEGLSVRSWTVENPDYDITWDIREVAGNAPGNQAAWMNFFDYYALDPHDMLISPVLNFSGFDEVYLSFQHAYAQRLSQKDSLIIHLSADCGESWDRIFAGGPDGNGIFATSPATEDFFLPQSEEDWCGLGYGADCHLIDLSPWAGMKNIQIMFETIGRYGNNLYIDNVRIMNSVNIPEKNPDDEIGFEVYPNPAAGQFSLTFREAHPRLHLEIFDSQGQIIYTRDTDRNPPGSVMHIDLSGYPDGVYMVNARSNTLKGSRKIVIRQ